MNERAWVNGSRIVEVAGFVATEAGTSTVLYCDLVDSDPKKHGVIRRHL